MALSDLSKAELGKLAEKHEITLERGSGADGAVLKDDLVEALRVAGVEPAPEPSVKRLYRVRRPWCGLAVGSVAEVDPERAWPFSSANPDRKSSPPHLSPLDEE